MQLFEKKILGCIEDLIINSLKRLKDEEYQRRVWFNTEGPLIDSYGEACVFFANRCEYLFKIRSCQEFLGNDNYSLLKKLYELVIDHFRLIDSRIDPDLLQADELLNDPNWHDIQTLAGEVKTKFTEFVERKEHDSNDGS